MNTPQTTWRNLALLAVLFALAQGCRGKPERTAPPPAQVTAPQAPAPAAGPAAAGQARAQAQAQSEADQRDFGDNPEYFVRPGLLACRTSRWVRLSAMTVAIGAADPAEFALISESSGHDYEALAVSFAAPSNVHAALEFIGMTPGRPVNGETMAFWPKGERVRLTFALPVGPQPDAPTEEVPAEVLFINRRAEKALAETGWVFVGSQWLPSPDSPKRRYAADAVGPNAIASTYNEGTTVFDLPWRAAKGELYDSITPNPDRPLPRARYVQVWIRPELPPGETRVRDFALEIRPGADPAAASLDALRFRLLAQADVVREGSTTEILAAFGALTEAGKDPFVTLRFDAALPLRAVSETCRFVASIEGVNGIRVDPPPAGQPYYQAFLPSEKFRTPAGRPVQPWELHLTRQDGAVKAMLRRIEEKWEDDKDEPTLTQEDIPVPAAAALPGLLEPKKYPSVILIFAPADLRYGELLEYAGPAMRSHPTLYVFLPLEARQP